MENQRADKQFGNQWPPPFAIDPDIFEKLCHTTIRTFATHPPLTSYRPNVNSILDAICHPKVANSSPLLRLTPQNATTKSIYNGRHYGREQNHPPLFPSPFPFPPYPLFCVPSSPFLLPHLECKYAKTRRRQEQSPKTSKDPFHTRLSPWTSPSTRKRRSNATQGIAAPAF